MEIKNNLKNVFKSKNRYFIAFIKINALIILFYDLKLYNIII